MNRFAAVVLGLVATQTFADPPDLPTPPVHHTNQGRNVDHIPQIGSEPRNSPNVGNDRYRRNGRPIRDTDRHAEKLREPDFPVFRVGSSLDLDGGQVEVTPSPGTVGVLALGGLMLSGRRRRN